MASRQPAVLLISVVGLASASLVRTRAIASIPAADDRADWFFAAVAAAAFYCIVAGGLRAIQGNSVCNGRLRAFLILYCSPVGLREPDDPGSC